MHEAIKQKLHDIVFVSDGIEETPVTAQDRLHQLAATAQQEGIRLFAIAVGTRNNAFPELRVNPGTLDTLAGKSLLLDVIALERQARQDDAKYQQLIAVQLQSLVERLNAQHRRAYDLTFTLPKMPTPQQTRAGQLALTLGPEELRVPLTVTAIPIS